MPKRAKPTTGDEPSQTIRLKGFTPWRVMLGPPGFKEVPIECKLPGVYCIGVRHVARSKVRFVYIGATDRTLAVRLREHRSLSSHLQGVIEQELEFGNIVYCCWYGLKSAQGGAKTLEKQYLLAYRRQWYWNAIGYGSPPPTAFRRPPEPTLQSYLECYDRRYAPRKSTR